MHFGSEKYHFRVAVGADGVPFGKDDEATPWLISFLRAIVRENRADLMDRGRPIPSIFWQCNTFHQQC